jgi:hypothetical protein
MTDMKLTEEETKITQKAFGVSLANERFNRYELYRGKENFNEAGSKKRFDILKTVIKDLKNYCVNCGSDN